jgi:hypothetical protein
LKKINIKGGLGMRILNLVILLSLFTAPLVLRAEWNEKKVGKIVKEIGKGEKDLVESSGSDTRRIIRIEVGKHSIDFGYLIDLESKLCFAYYKEGALIIVPCENVKQGYPAVAPLLSWVK